MQKANQIKKSHRKRKNSPAAWVVLLIFLLKLEISGVAVYRIHQNSKTDGFCGELLSENHFEAALATFYCHDYGGNASEAVQKIATDQKDYQKCSSCVTVC